MFDAGERDIQKKIDRLSSQLMMISSRAFIDEDPSLYYKPHHLELPSIVTVRPPLTDTLKGINFRPVKIHADKFINQIQVIGGNHAGIFIGEMKSEEKTELKVGDQLVKVIELMENI